MTPPDPEVLASRWRLDDLLAGTREVEVHAATDTELGTDVVAVLWSDDPGPEGRQVTDRDVVLVDTGVHDGVWFATYARADGVPLAPAAKAALARRFVPDDHAGTAGLLPPSGPHQRRGLVAAGVAGLIVLLAAGGILLGQSDRGGGIDDLEPRAAEAEVEREPIREPLREALRELRTAAGAEGRADVAVVEEAVVRRDWPAAEQALDRVVRRDRGGDGRLAVAAARVRAELPVRRPAPEEEPVTEPEATPCETTTTTSAAPTSSTTSTSTSTSTTSTTTAPGATTTTAPCDPTATTTTTVPGGSTTSTSTSTTTTEPSTTTSTTVATSSTTTTSTSTTTTTTEPRRRRVRVGRG